MYDTAVAVKKSVYPAQVMLKTAYGFIDSNYIHIDERDDEWIVELTAKSGQTDPNIVMTFENELIMQTVRLNIYQKTHAIRELLIARSMASSIVDMNDSQKESHRQYTGDNPDITDEELENILTDWFEDHE